MGKIDITVYKLHFILSCIISNNYLQRAQGTILVTTLNNHCKLHRPMLLVMKTDNPTHNQMVIFNGSTMLYCLFRNDSAQYSKRVIFTNSSRNTIRTDFKNAFKTHVLKWFCAHFIDLHIALIEYRMCVFGSVKKTWSWQYTFTIKPR